MATALYVLLVIYRKNGGQSPACESLRRAGFSHVLMADNSEEDFGNEAYCREVGWEYLKMPGNSGLSRAYNAGIARLKGRADYVILLDDDTTLGQAYIGALQYALCVSPDTDVFLPRVTDRVGLLSPCRSRYLGVHRVADPATIPPGEISAINSGMAISMKVFDNYTYDERYFLDFIDHAFMRDMRATGKSIRLLEVELKQRFSGSDRNISREKVLRRFRTYRQDCRVFYSNIPFGRLYVPLALLRRRIGIAKQLGKRKKEREV